MVEIEREAEEFRGMYEELQQLLAPCDAERVTRDVSADRFVWDTEENQFLMKTDAAVELGGGNLPAVSGVLYLGLSGSDADTADGSECVTLYGADLPDLKGDAPYARVTLISLKQEFLTEEFKLYNLLRSIEYIRYHVSPKGYMPRISTVQNREQVRVSGEAVARGLTFYHAGRIYGDAYLKHPAVDRVSTVFITLPDFPYRDLQRLFERAESRIMSLEHPLDHLKMDCGSCNLKEVCEQVENLCVDNFGPPPGRGA